MRSGPRTGLPRCDCSQCEGVGWHTTDVIPFSASRVDCPQRLVALRDWLKSRIAHSQSLDPHVGWRNRARTLAILNPKRWT
jgi:hypothetical protein